MNMRAESTTTSGSDSETQVMLNVYDLTHINNYTYWFGCGIFHSGIEGEFFAILIPGSCLVSADCLLCYCVFMIRAMLVFYMFELN